MTLPRWPTNHPPGSPGKIKVMALRAELGLDLFDPEDIGLDNDPLPVILHTARVDDILANLSQMAQETDLGPS